MRIRVRVRIRVSFMVRIRHLLIKFVDKITSPQFHRWKLVANLLIADMECLRFEGWAWGLPPFTTLHLIPNQAIFL